MAYVGSKEIAERAANRFYDAEAAMTAKLIMRDHLVSDAKMSEQAASELVASIITALSCYGYKISR